MKIVKQHKSRTKHSERFGIWSGKTLEEIKTSENISISNFTAPDKFAHLKVGSQSHGHFILIEDLEEVKFLREYLQKVEARFSEDPVQ